MKSRRLLTCCIIRETHFSFKESCNFFFFFTIINNNNNNNKSDWFYGSLRRAGGYRSFFLTQFSLVIEDFMLSVFSTSIFGILLVNIKSIKTSCNLIYQEDNNIQDKQFCEYFLNYPTQIYCEILYFFFSIWAVTNIKSLSKNTLNTNY